MTQLHPLQPLDDEIITEERESAAEQHEHRRNNAQNEIRVIEKPECCEEVAETQPDDQEQPPDRLPQKLAKRRGDESGERDESAIRAR